MGPRFIIKTGCIYFVSFTKNDFPVLNGKFFGKAKNDRFVFSFSPTNVCQTLASILVPTYIPDMNFKIQSFVILCILIFGKDLMKITVHHKCSYTSQNKPIYRATNFENSSNFMPHSFVLIWSFPT